MKRKLFIGFLICVFGFIEVASVSIGLLHIISFIADNWFHLLGDYASIIASIYSLWALIFKIALFLAYINE